MKAIQKVVRSIEDINNFKLDFEPQLMLIFASPSYPNIQESLSILKECYPNTSITGCSTSGEIQDINVIDDSLVVNAIKFDNTGHKIVSKNIDFFEDSYQLGKTIFDELYSNDLQHILIFSDGLLINGAQLVKGLALNLPTSVSITGGLAGDGEKFESTFVINNNITSSGDVIGIGLYGNSLQVGFSSKGGWDSFGLERRVTKSEGNVLFELDNEPALSLYKSFLGSKANELPSSGLLFPLSLRTSSEQKPVVRTILAINENTNSLTFAGDIPEGSYVRLMKANVDRLISGAEDSASNTKLTGISEPEFALLISCVGRRMVLKQMVEEELEAVRDVLGEKPIISGFYSYGELAPFEKFTPCELHNQTMTITTFSESSQAI